MVYKRNILDQLDPEIFSLFARWVTDRIGAIKFRPLAAPVADRGWTGGSAPGAWLGSAVVFRG